MNGNFSAGNTGFASELTLDPSGVSKPVCGGSRLGPRAHMSRVQGAPLVICGSLDSTSRMGPSECTSPAVCGNGRIDTGESWPRYGPSKAPRILPTLRTMDALRLLMTGACPNCRAMFPVNRLADAGYCGACGHEIPIAEATWSTMLREAVVRAAGLATGETRSVAERELTLSYKRVAFSCLTCGRVLASKDALGKDEDRCDGCGTALCLRPVASTPYAAFLGEISHIYGEDPEKGSANEPGAIAQFPCASCGAALPVEGNAQRVVCTYCRRPSHVPLSFLYRGHRDLPQPWGVLFSAPLPAKTAELSEIFDWAGAETTLPYVASLGPGKLLISATYEGFEQTADFDIRNTETRAIVALGARAGTLEPQLLWQRRDLPIATGCERRPHVVVAGAQRIFVRTYRGIVILDSLTGDTVRILPVDCHEAAYFEAPSLALSDDEVIGIRGHETRLVSRPPQSPLAHEDTKPRPSLKALRAATTLAVAEPSTLLAAGYFDNDTLQAWVCLATAAGEPRLRGRVPLPNDDDRDQENMHVSLADDTPGAALLAGTFGASVWLHSDREVYRGAPVDGQLQFQRIQSVRLAGKKPRSFVAIGFGHGVAVIGARGAFRTFNAEGQLSFDASSLPRPVKQSRAAMVKEADAAKMRKAMDSVLAEQAETTLANTEYERAEYAKNMRIVIGTLVAFVVLAVVGTAVVFLATR